MWINIRKILLVILMIALASALAYFLKKRSPNKDDAKLYEVRQLYSQVPLPQDFQETGHSTSSKAESALE